MRGLRRNQHERFPVPLRDKGVTVLNILGKRAVRGPSFLLGRATSDLQLERQDIHFRQEQKIIGIAVRRKKMAKGKKKGFGLES